MLNKTKNFMTKHLRNVKAAGLELGGAQILFPPVPAKDYLNSENWKVNAENAARELGVPQTLWNDITLYYRKTFGVAALLETLFFMGFAVGWWEGQAQKLAGHCQPPSTDR
jgi:hypothetical protein